MSDDIGQWTIKGLKSLCTSLGLKTGGTKAELLSRLASVCSAKLSESKRLLVGVGVDDGAAGCSQSNDDDDDDYHDAENSANAKTSQLIADVKMIDAARAFVPEFGDKSDASFWTELLFKVRDKYCLNDEVLRAVFATKLGGKAKEWFQSQLDGATADINELIRRFKEIFTDRESKLTIRRRFESRKWQFGETFSEYYTDKLILGERAAVSEQEFVEYAVDGIPDRRIREMAIMNQFRSRADLLRAMRGIQLEKREENESAAAKGKRTTNRCYNCNSVGHFAADCKKVKREKGTCYGCGDAAHRIADCPKNKKKSTKNNDYVRKYLITSKEAGTNFKYFADCLIDSGSPISFVKQSLVPENLNIENDELVFYGINKSHMNSFGKFKVKVHLINKNVEIDLLVVSEDTMRYNVVLGRDFLKEANSKLIIDDEVLPIDGFNNYDQHEQEIMAIDMETNNVDLNIGANISENDSKSLHKLFQSIYIKGKRPIENLVKSEMKLILENHKPFNCPPRRLSYAEKQKLQIVLDEYLEKGIIRPSESEHASPIVLVPKKTGEIRMCVDFRQLNKNTAKLNYPIPLIDDLLERLNNKKFFSKLDLKNAFFHVSMNEESVKYTSFITPLGQFEFLKMPFGLKNAPSTFQMFINKVFNDLVRQGKVIIYLDDIMIATENINDHLEILSMVLVKLVENNLELRIDKCRFLEKEIEYLGYIIDEFGIRANEKGLESIKNFPLPQKVQSVQSFLGLCSYFRRFIKDFSLIAKPLHDLTKKDKPFSFGENELNAFETLKKKLIEAPVIALFDPLAETELHCDASALGFGAILLQKGTDKKWHPVFYFSKRSTEAEAKFHSFELETLAIIYALRRFRVYLQGRSFVIVTDCNSLMMTLNKKELNPRIARWALEMQNFDYTVQHRAGIKMQHVDSLSRCNEILMIDSNTFEENLIICQNRDNKIVKIKGDLEMGDSKFYEMRNGVVYKKLEKIVLFYVPEVMESQVLFKYHNELGHLGVNKVVDLIGKSYWFPNIKTKVETHIKNCLDCIPFSAKNGKLEGNLHNITKPQVPFEMVHIDHYGPVDKNTAKKYLLVVIDACTKFIKLYATKTTATSEVISALKEYFRYYSRPKCIVSDRGTSFTSKEFEKCMTDYNIKHIKIATGSPQANGQVERVNRNLGPIIAKLCKGNGPWDKCIEMVEFALNNTVHRMINTHPSIMLFGVNQKGKVVDKIREELENNNVNIDLSTIRNNAKQNEEKAQKYNENYVNTKRKSGTQYEVDDYVVIRNYDNSAGTSRKLIPKFKGPYKISKILPNDRFLIEDVEGFQQTQIPYKGVWAIQNIKPWLRNDYNLRSRAVSGDTELVRTAEL